MNSPMPDRLPPLQAEDMDEAQRAAAEELVAGPRKGVSDGASNGTASARPRHRKRSQARSTTSSSSAPIRKNAAANNSRSCSTISSHCQAS